MATSSRLPAPERLDEGRPHPWLHVHAGSAGESPRPRSPGWAGKGGKSFVPTLTRVPEACGPDHPESRRTKGHSAQRRLWKRTCVQGSVVQGTRDTLRAEETGTWLPPQGPHHRANRQVHTLWEPRSRGVSGGWSPWRSEQLGSPGDAGTEASLSSPRGNLGQQALVAEREAGVGRERGRGLGERGPAAAWTWPNQEPHQSITQSVTV